MTTNTELLNSIVEAFATQIAERAAEIIVRKYPAFDIARFEQVERAVSGLLGISEQGADEEAPLTRDDVSKMIEAAFDVHLDDYDHDSDTHPSTREVRDLIDEAFMAHTSDDDHMSERDITKMIDEAIDEAIAAHERDRDHIERGSVGSLVDTRLRQVVDAMQASVTLDGAK
jgi:AcrR family transcriptional regulator